MNEFLTNTDSEPFWNEYLKTKLKEKYADSLNFAEGEGLQDSDNEREDITNTEILFQRSSKGRGITETNDYIKCNVPSITA